MKKLSEQQLAWFKGLQTETRNNGTPHFMPDERVSWRRDWFMGILLVMTSFLLFWYSFSPVWGNPGEEVQTEDVLIPIHELMNGEEKEVELPQQSNVTESRSSNQQERQVEEKSDQSSSNVENIGDKHGRMIQSRSNAETKKVESQQNKETTSTNDAHPSSVQQTPQTKEIADSTSDVRTENGGKLPKTATPFGAYFLRGLALFLLGMGIRFLNRDRLHKKFIPFKVSSKGMY